MSDNKKTKTKKISSKLSSAAFTQLPLPFYSTSDAGREDAGHAESPAPLNTPRIHRKRTSGSK